MSSAVMASGRKLRDPEEVQSYSFSDSPYKEDIKKLASDYMDAFFHDKRLKTGLPIPRNLLYTAENLSLVMNTRMPDGVQMFYETFEAEFEAPPEEWSPPLSFDTRFLMGVLDECAHRKIPKQFASGIALIFLRICAPVPRKLAASA